MQSDRWTIEQTKLAFHLYCQLPFGKLDQRNPEVIELAQLITRTPSAVAMKLVNFASLDPAITGSGRKGLSNASALDRAVWEAFNADWEGLAVECQQLRDSLAAQAASGNTPLDPGVARLERIDFTGESRTVVTEQRIKQAFFRRAVLSSYRGRCCMSGLDEPRLLIASHIVPWSQDKRNRLNPRNGLCLSTLHDRAFDQGLIALTDDLGVIVSRELQRSKNEFIQSIFQPLQGRTIETPERFVPSPEFLGWHRSERFVDNRVA